MVVNHPLDISHDLGIAAVCLLGRTATGLEHAGGLRVEDEGHSEKRFDPFCSRVSDPSRRPAQHFRVRLTERGKGGQGEGRGPMLLPTYKLVSPVGFEGIWESPRSTSLSQL